MIPTTALGAGPMPAQAALPETGALAPQNLFEHMARTSSSTQQAVTPAELGASVMSKLEGTIERVQNFAGRIGGEFEAAKPTAAGEGTGGDKAEALGDAQFERMIESFSAMFDHAVEARLMASCASQTSGACTTLLRGQ